MRHTFPIANSPLSKRSKTPRNTNATPKPAKPTPISKSKKCIYNFCQLYKKYSNFIHFDSLCVSLISNILPYYNTTERDEYIVAMQNLNFNFADKSVLIKNLRFLMTFVQQKRRNFSIVTDDERSTSKTKCQPRVRWTFSFSLGFIGAAVKNPGRLLFVSVYSQLVALLCQTTIRFQTV